MFHRIFSLFVISRGQPAPARDFLGRCRTLFTYVVYCSTCFSVYALSTLQQQRLPRLPTASAWRSSASVQGCHGSSPGCLRSPYREGSDIPPWLEVQATGPQRL